MFRGLLRDKNMMPDLDLKGRRHFNADLKKTSLYGCENDCKGDIINKKADFARNMNKNKKEELPQKYGSWWSPPKKEDKETESQSQFFGRMRDSASANKKRLTGVAGFSLGDEDDSNNQTECIDANNSGTIHANSLDSTMERSRRCEDSDNHNQFIEQDRPSKEYSDSLSFENNLIRRAEERASERQKLTRRDSSFDHVNCENSRTSGNLNQIDKIHASGDHASMEPLKTQPMDSQHITQKQMLEQHMSGSSTRSYIYRPPWHTSYDENNNVSERRLRKPVQHEDYNQKQGKQRTCNQIDFPAYTAEEMSVARKNMCSSNRNEKCSWLPNMAADFNIERRRRIPSSNMNVNSDCESRMEITKPIVENSLVDRVYNSKARVTAPYASHE